jgi:hypothetical protein
VVAVVSLGTQAVSGVWWIDSVHALDVDEYAYVYFCHLSPNGNQLIAAHIAKFVQP